MNHTNIDLTNAEYFAGRLSYLAKKYENNSINLEEMKEFFNLFCSFLHCGRVIVTRVFWIVLILGLFLNILSNF